MSEISKKELIDLLGKLVSYNTVNIPTDDVKAPKDCPEFIEKHLQEKGIDAKLFEDEGYYSVYGKVGEGKFNLLLMAHF
ncbi:MAG: peptidase, partial [Candidatus Heimdallarchaeota archaeon]|nr:peptidase [Candidatus Heimdallarchaeota archaeon]